jgi:arabinofuranosyltransferase
MAATGGLRNDLVALPDEAVRPTPLRDVRRFVQAAVLAAPVVWVVLVGWAHRWMTEDGFIYLRVVRQIREGNGPVFNQGERVEAFTGVLWVGLLSIADLVAPIRLEWLAVLLGLVSTAGAVALSLAGARRLWARYTGGAFSVPFGAVVFVAVFPLWAFATSGLETGLVFAWLGGCFWILAGWAAEPTRLSAPRAVILGLGWLVRPEMVLFSAAFVVVVLAAQWSRDGWRHRARFVVAAVALPVAYQVFRMGFYGSLVANTAVVKEGSSASWERGWRYLSDFTGPYWLWVPAVGLLAGGYLPLGSLLAKARDRRRALVVATFVAGGVLNGLYVVAVGGDYHHGRMYLPALFALCAPVAAVPLTRRHLAGTVVAAWALVAVLSLRPDQHEDDNWLAGGFLAPREFGSVTTDDHGWGESDRWLAWYAGPAYYYEEGIYNYSRADMAVRSDVALPFGAFWGVGISAYAVGPDFHVLDQLGLADSFTAHLRREPSFHPVLPRFPGHEKPLPGPWLAARVTPAGSAPDPANFPPFYSNPLIPATTGAEFQEQVAWARAALECDEIGALLDSAEEPLSARRFVTNLWRSVEQTRMRVPADPQEAYRRYCGAGTPSEVRAVRAEPAGS